MTRKFGGGRLVLATHNPGKAREIAALMAPLGIDVVTAAELGLPEPEETGATFIANAELKALAAAQASDLPALADDSGLVVEALDGAPGLFSARYAREAREAAGLADETQNFGPAMARVHEELAARGALEADKRRAHFVAALSLAWPDGHTESFEGHFVGSLIWPPRGENGFGYDPMFLPDGYEITAGEMESEHKHAISHRAQAFKQLLEACFRT